MGTTQTPRFTQEKQGLSLNSLLRFAMGTGPDAAPLATLARQPDGRWHVFVHRHGAIEPSAEVPVGPGGVPQSPSDCSRALARLGYAVVGEWQSDTGEGRSVPVFGVEVRAHVAGESRSEWQLVRDTDGDEVTVTVIASADGQRVSVQGGAGEAFHGEQARQRAVEERVPAYQARGYRLAAVRATRRVPGPFHRWSPVKHPARR